MKISLSTLSGAIKAEGGKYDTKSWHITKWHKLENEDNWFGKVDIGFTDPTYNARWKPGKASSQPIVFFLGDIRDLVDLCLRLWLSRAIGPIFVLG